MYWTCLKRDNLALARQWSLKLMKNPNRIKKIWIRNATNVIKEVLFSKNELCSLKYQCSIAANENRMNFISWKLCISILALNVNFPKESMFFPYKMKIIVRACVNFDDIVLPCKRNSIMCNNHWLLLLLYFDLDHENLEGWSSNNFYTYSKQIFLKKWNKLFSKKINA